MEKELFLKALWLSKPWYIKELKLDVEKERLDIYLDFEKRKKEVKSNKALKWSRYLWLKKPKNLNEKKLLELEDLKKENATLAEAYQMKENIKEFFEKETKGQAELFLQLWCDYNFYLNKKLCPLYYSEL